MKLPLPKSILLYLEDIAIDTIDMIICIYIKLQW